MSNADITWLLFSTQTFMHNIDLTSLIRLSVCNLSGVFYMLIFQRFKTLKANILTDGKKNTPQRKASGKAAVKYPFAVPLCVSAVPAL